MFSPEVTIIAVVGLVVLATGGVLYALLQPQISGDTRQSKRVAQAATSRTQVVADRRNVHDADKRRKSIQDSLKEIEQRQKTKAKKSNEPGLMTRIQQAGLTWSRRQFTLISVAVGAVLALLALLQGMPLLVVGGAAIVGGLGMPRWYVNFLRKRRIKAFLEELPNAVDVIVRGIKAGLPLSDCMRVISMEAREPVKTEFRRIVEAQAMGVPISEAVAKLPERMPTPEANFFAIVIAIQSQAGGNLSEALGNLSKVLRDRKRMRGKIQAVSMEAKASAGIIGSLPVIVAALIYITSPGYIAILFIEPVGKIILGLAGFWMFCGVMIMRRMINFEI
ncbi:tight adherence protein B [Breoghania corrubedonensis]|uniref:Tight adherence protein B n=1 Tax=Breoghania corrubedonensis TaxID=665038 RepID=A0A2T5VG32_9HYPH|nr:type II secretion system F family protein [Breoghania corrubedonensis]PTW62713.1 tight adherence protein B [Breoghania corrubedonensis]